VKSENPDSSLKLVARVESPSFGKSLTIPRRMPLFVGHELTPVRDRKPHFKFHMKKDVLPIYRMMPKMLGFLGWVPDFRGTRFGR
jgi:hypothetical protein